ncbi:MAG: helix-turn-helix domain-containing protein [Candidatus Binatia bacterium]
MTDHHVQRKVDIKEAASFLGVPISWLYDRTRRNLVPHLKMGKYVRFDLYQLESWAKAGCPAEWE